MVLFKKYLQKPSKFAKIFLPHKLIADFRVFKQKYNSLGRIVLIPHYEPEYTNGIFYITNKRTVFVAKKNGFDKEIVKLTAITPYSNGIELQYGTKTYGLIVPDGDVPKHVLELIT